MSRSGIFLVQDNFLLNKDVSKLIPGDHDVQDLAALIGSGSGGSGRSCGSGKCFKGLFFGTRQYSFKQILLSKVIQDLQNSIGKVLS